MSKVKITSKGSVRTGVRGAEKPKGSVKREDLIPIKEAAFAEFPWEIEEKLKLQENDDSQMLDSENMEELLDYDEIDYETVDEDETFADEVSAVSELYFSGLPGTKPSLNNRPEVLPKNVYPLIILPDQENHCRCSFEAPQWMHCHMPASKKKYIYILRDFLIALAGWLEENKQDFLCDPIPENFVKNENCRPENCIVLQDGFLQQVNQHMPPYGKMTKSYLSRLYDKIWFFWPKYNMPLSAIFSEPYQNSFREAWVIEGCFRRYAEAEAAWRDGRQYKSFSTHDLDSMAQKFDQLDPEEHLYLLCKTVKMVKRIDYIYLAIIDKISGEANA